MKKKIRKVTPNQAEESEEEYLLNHYEPSSDHHPNDHSLNSDYNPHLDQNQTNTKTRRTTRKVYPVEKDDDKKMIDDIEPDEIEKPVIEVLHFLEPKI
jgi:hypothetical protein